MTKELKDRGNQIDRKYKFTILTSCQSPEIARFRKSIVWTGEYFSSRKLTYASTVRYSSSFPVILGINSISRCFASSAVIFCIEGSAPAGFFCFFGLSLTTVDPIPSADKRELMEGGGTRRSELSRERIVEKAQQKVSFHPKIARARKDFMLRYDGEARWSVVKMVEPNKYYYYYCSVSWGCIVRLVGPTN